MALDNSPPPSEDTLLHPQPELETARLRLRPFAPADAPVVQALAGTREIADTTLNVPHPYPDGAAEAWIATHGPAWAAGVDASYAVTEAAGGALVGAVGLALTPALARAELGYWVAVPAWGRGYATEAAAALRARARLPERAAADAVHVALAAVHGVDYLLTWNLRHIANAELRPAMEAACRAAGYAPPVIATPDGLMGG